MRVSFIVLPVLLVLLIAGCQQDALILPPNSAPHATGKIVLTLPPAPAGVSAVIATLSRSGFDTVRISLNLSDSGQGASGSMDGLSAGPWHLEVDAFDEYHRVIYTGATDVTIVPGQVTDVSLTLEPASGGIRIIVTWGTSILFSDNFNQGNINGWTYKTGSWSFVDSVVLADTNYGHHFLMLSGHDFSDFEFQADVMKTGDDGFPEHPGLVFRWLSDTMNYVFRINGVGSQSWIQLMRDMDNRDMNSSYISTEPWLTSDPDHRMDRDTWYTMKVRAQGTHIQCKVWKKSDSEPDGWILDVDNPAYSHGLIGLEYYTGRHKFDNVLVTAVH